MSIKRGTWIGAAIRTRWQDLERDWQSLVVAAAIVATIVAFEPQIPW